MYFSLLPRGSRLCLFVCFFGWLQNRRLIFDHVVYTYKPQQSFLCMSVYLLLSYRCRHDEAGDLTRQIWHDSFSSRFCICMYKIKSLPRKLPSYVKSSIIKCLFWKCVIEWIFIILISVYRLLSSVDSIATCSLKWGFGWVLL